MPALPEFLAKANSDLLGFIAVALVTIFIGGIFIWGGIRLVKSPSFKNNSAGCVQIGLVVLLFLLGGGAVLLGLAIGGCGYILSSPADFR